MKQSLTLSKDTTQLVLALNAQDAARALSISERLLGDWSRKKIIPHVKIGGRYLYPTTAIDKWLTDHAVASINHQNGTEQDSTIHHIEHGEQKAGEA